MEFLLLFVFYPTPTFPLHISSVPPFPNMEKTSGVSNMSNFTQEFSEEDEEFQNTIIQQYPNGSSTLENERADFTPNQTTPKKKRSLPGNPDPDAEVIALSPRTLMATNRYVCEVCHKGFQRDQNLQLHRRGHNLPWKLKQKSSPQVKKVYICPELSCIHHDPSRALGDLTGIKKHFCRKHGEKKWKCDKCLKRYAVQSDWKAHSKICGTREYRCDCGTVFSRKDSFVTHRAFCDALAEENYKVNQRLAPVGGMLQTQAQELLSSSMPISSSHSNTNTMMNPSISNQNADNQLRSLSLNSSGVTFSGTSDPIFNPSTLRVPSACFIPVSGSNNTHMAVASTFMSATALLQKATEMGAKISDNSISPILYRGFTGCSTTTMNSYGSIQEASLIVDHKMGMVSGTTHDPYVGTPNPFEKSSESGNPDLRPGSSVCQSGLLDSYLLMQSREGNSVDLLEGVFMGGEEERMTVDFLGVEQAGHLKNGGDTNSDGNAIDLGYSDEQNHHNMNLEWLTHPS